MLVKKNDFLTFVLTLNFKSMLFRKYVHKCILLIVIGFSISLHVDAQVLKGVVVDSEHVGLPGVSVSIKGSGTGTITDSKGIMYLAVCKRGYY